MLSNRTYTRPHAADLLHRLIEPHRFLQIVTESTAGRASFPLSGNVPAWSFHLADP